MIIGGHRLLFLTKNIKCAKLAISSRTLWCYCGICLVLAKYKVILNKIMNGDPKLLFHIFKVKYLMIIYCKYYEFLSVSFP